ncbi:MAG: AbrB/MazE/SpoVT family DNA-binding domain-containing protein [Promethearchaeota archaeon]
MERRKVISLGKASYAIILPKDWIVENDVKKSDELFVYAQKDGRITIQKHLNPRTSVTIDDADILSEEVLRFAVQSSYILNVDDVVLRASSQESFSPLLDRITRMARKFQGLSTSFSEREVVLNCLLEMKTINIPKIFEEIYQIFKLILSHIKAGHHVDLSNQIDDMERKYILGVRYLIYSLQHQHEIGGAGSGGLDHLIQTLGYRLCLKVVRNLTLSTHILHNLLKGEKIPEFQDTLGPVLEITRESIDLTLNPDIEKLKVVEAEFNDLEPNLDAIEVAHTEYHEAVLNFIEVFRDSVRTLLHTAMSRYIESQVGLI